ncbi:MAG: 16S rRNA (cytidine(1402)-2'-O)-methyltransferase [Actinomycetota bacterium]
MRGARVSGALIVVATPIGNLGDLSPRAAAALIEADVVACEDTRVTRTLLMHAAGMTGARRRGRLVAYHAHNERERAPELARAIAAGERVALVTDAGMPGVSDPGRHLVAACVEAGLRIEVVPGPSAVPAALVLSGMPAARFVFEGFLPRTGAARRRRLEELATERRTIVLFESPHRVADTLGDMARAWGPRQVAVAREMTKLYEEVLRGTLPELAESLAEGVRGEVTIVVEGAPEALRMTEPADLADAVADLVAAGTPKRDAIAQVALEEGVPKKTVYQAVLDHSGE